MTPWTRPHFAALCPRRVIGMLHLAPLPGSPGWAGDLAAVIDAALRDARTLRQGGIRALMLENFHDVPFHADAVPPVTVAALTAAAAAVRRKFRRFIVTRHYPWFETLVSSRAVRASNIEDEDPDWHNTSLNRFGRQSRI